MKGNTYLCYHLVLYVLSPLVVGAASCDNVTGYQPFPGAYDDDNVVGLLWTVDNQIYTSTCSVDNKNCQDGSLLYEHNVTITDMDIYYDGCGLYITDNNGAVFWLDMSRTLLVPASLPSPLVVDELSVDWLTPRLYVITSNWQIYACDIQLQDCDQLHNDSPSYKPMSLVADPFNGYLYWLTQVSQLVKHDLAKDLSRSANSSEIALTSNVLTYSVVFNHYDLFSIYKYNSSYSEITLTYLNGKNEETHIDLNHSAGYVYAQLNCFHSTYCLWLGTNNNITSPYWSLHGSIDPTRISNLNMTGSSVLTQWHRQVQPLPEPKTWPTFTEFYSSSSAVELHWDKPDIIGSFITQQSVVSWWKAKLRAEDFKYMQSSAAWAAWTYELNVTDGQQISTFADLTDRYVRVFGLESATKYSVSVLAYNGDVRGPARTTTISTLADDPIIYTSGDSYLKSIDTFGTVSQSWDLSSFDWTICEIVTRDDNSTYAIVVLRDQPLCSRSSSSLILLDVSALSVTVLDKLAKVSAVTYDWIGRMVYFTSSVSPSLFRADAYSTPMAAEAELLTSLPSTAVYLTMDSFHAQIYWANHSDICKCELGPPGSYRPTSIYSWPVASGHNGPLVDLTSGRLYWIAVASGTAMLRSADLVDGKSGPNIFLPYSSYAPFQVSEGKMYVILNQGLTTLNLNPKRLSNVLDTNATSFLYKTAGSYPLLPGMDNTTNPVEYVLPQIADNSVNVSGEYDNFTVSWSLSSPRPSPSVQVLYNISVTEFTSRDVVYASSTHTGTRTPYLTGVDPQTRLRLIIQPYTNWRNGASQKIILDSPATVPGAVEHIRMLVRSSQSEHELIIRWDPPSFTGGVISTYNISVTSQDGTQVATVKKKPLHTVPVEVHSLYGVRVCASTEAGYGNWSDLVMFNSSTASPLPVFYTLPYTPELIEAKWDLSPLITDSLYTYKIRHFSDHQDWKSEYVLSSKQMYRMKELKSNTTYRANMHVCCKSDNRSLWFAGVQCEFTNTAMATTFLRPQPLTVLAIGSHYISLSWTSPAVQQVISYAIRYKAVGEGSYRSTTVTETTAQSNYTTMLSELTPDTSYEIILVLQYPHHSDYTLPSSADKPFIVTTNQSVPGVVSVLSVDCSDDTCKIVTSAANVPYLTKVKISCPGDFKPLIYDVDIDGTKHVSRSLLPEEISECTVVAWSANSVGAGSTSAPMPMAEKKEADNSNAPLAIALSLAGVFVLAVGVVSFLFYTRCRKTHQKYPEAHFDVNSGVVSLPSTDLMHLRNMSTTTPPLFTMTENSLYEEQGALQFRESISEESSLVHNYEREKLTLTKFLGRGAFGEVYAGKARDIVTPGTTNLVAVKTLKSGASQAYKEEFIKEGKLMSQFNSEFIVRLLGVCIDREPYYIIIELMNEGDLVAFLRKSRPSRDKAGSLSLTELVSICIDVAAGCKYLEMLHFVHRDLAARNCLVNLPTGECRYRVKLGDFGLARDIYRNDYYRKEGEALLPVRWMSPEALVDGVFTTQSDIWAFGVLMWEVFSLAAQPYPARSNIEVLKFVTNSGTLDKPSRCPQILFEMMVQCWDYQSIQRPSFKDIYSRLCDFKTNGMTEEVLSLFNTANQRLTSENEFFAGSASSGAGVTQAVIESPVFESDDRQPSVDMEHVSEVKENDNRTQRQLSNSSDQLSTSTPMKVLKKLFQRKRPGHMLERVHSMPVGSDRQTNRYVRSDSTISADGGRSVQTYTQQDGRQLSFDDSVLPKSGENGMKVIAEEKLKGSSLRVDISTSPLTCDNQPNVQYSTMAFGNPSIRADAHEARANNSSSIQQTVQYSTMSFEGKQASNDSRVQYATMAFGEREHLSYDGVETAGRGSAPPTLAVGEHSTLNKGLSAPVNSTVPDQMSSSHIPLSKASSHSTPLTANADNLDLHQQPVSSLVSCADSEQTTPAVQSTPYGAKVNYGSLQFSNKHSPLVRKKRTGDPREVVITPNEGIKTL